MEIIVSFFNLSNFMQNTFVSIYGLMQQPLPGFVCDILDASPLFIHQYILGLSGAESWHDVTILSFLFPCLFGLLVFRIVKWILDIVL